MKEHFRVYGIGWFVVHMFFFCLIILMSFLSYFEWSTDRHIMYVSIIAMSLWLLEGILGLTMEYEDDTN